jgi:hypothetical protein
MTYATSIQISIPAPRRTAAHATNHNAGATAAPQGPESCPACGRPVLVMAEPSSDAVLEALSTSEQALLRWAEDESAWFDAHPWRLKTLEAEPQGRSRHLKGHQPVRATPAADAGLDPSPRVRGRQAPSRVVRNRERRASRAHASAPVARLARPPHRSAVRSRNTAAQVWPVASA